jgi:hypothetical protein
MLHILWVLFLLWLAIAVLYGAARVLMAFGSAFDRLRNPPPRPPSRDEHERARHDAFMAQERERLDRQV